MDLRGRAGLMVERAFIADALSLGVHWVYNTRVIDKKIGTVDRYHDPLTSFHPGRQAGDFTHYGDQMIWLLESLAGEGEFDADAHLRRWREKMNGYDGYVDKASRSVLDNLSAGADTSDCASASDDLSAAALVAPLVYRYREDLSALVGAARTRAAQTHGHPDVADAAEFLARVSWRVLHGEAPVAALTGVSGEHFDRPPFDAWVEDGLASRRAETREAIADFGQMCSVEAGFPGVVHLVARFENDYPQAMIENVMAGGDSSARGMAAAAVLGARETGAPLPSAWVSELNAAGRIKRLLSKIP